MFQRFPSRSVGFSGCAKHAGPERKQEGAPQRGGYAYVYAYVYAYAVPTFSNAISEIIPIPPALAVIGGHSKPHLQHERLRVDRKSHNRKPQLRIDSGDFQPERGGMGETFEIAPQGN
jgi:hypothetical protein